VAAGVEAACGRPVAPGCMQLWRALLLLLLLLLLLRFTWAVAVRARVGEGWGWVAEGWGCSRTGKQTQLAHDR